MLKVKALSHVQINVNNMERSLRFYRDALGLEERMRTGGFVLLGAPGSPDFISLSESTPVGAPGLGHFGLHLDADDIEMAIKALKKAGGTLLSRGEYPNYPNALIADPDGYVIEIHTRPVF